MALADIFDFFSFARHAYRIGKFEYDLVTKWLESISDDNRRDRMAEAVRKYSGVDVTCPDCHRRVAVLSLRAGTNGFVCSSCDCESSNQAWWEENPDFE